MSHNENQPQQGAVEPLVTLYDAVLGAQGVADVRTGWTPESKVALGAAPERARVTVVEAMISRLNYLGLDTVNSDDERIVQLTAGVEAMLDTRHPDHIANYPAYGVIAAYDRIVSGLNVASLNRLQLMPLQELEVNDDIYWGLKGVALPYTNPEQYTVSRGLGGVRQAKRTVTDVLSPYWGFEIATDTKNGISMSAKHGPSVALSVPTGQLSLSAITAAVAFESLSQADALQAGKPVPPRVILQSIPSSGFSSEQFKNRARFDTSDRQVESFMHSILQTI